MVSPNYHQRLPDIDPEETDEWLESLRSVVDSAGIERARLLLHEVLSEAQDLGIQIPPASQTPYVNTIPWDNQVPYPGDLQIEKEIQNIILSLINSLQCGRLADTTNALQTFTPSSMSP